MIEYWQTGLVPQFPTLIVCGFSVIAALLSIFSGFILQVINAKEKQEFEFRLQTVQMQHRLLMKLTKYEEFKNDK